MKINTEKKYQKMVSWGTSAAWWSQQMKDGKTADEISKLLFNEETGLGLNVYRFNIGAGESENPNTRLKWVDRKTESFYYYDEAEGRYVYDFTRDSAAVMMMDKALAAGADSVIMFCNSPHYSMTVSGQASGGLTKKFSNLPEENYQAFVDYVLTIADHFSAEGYPVKYISPINEPQWDWGGDDVTQEGCYYTPEEAVKLLEIFAVTMQKRNTTYGLLGIESGEISKDYYDYIDAFAKSKILTDYCDTFCAHSYWIDHEIETKIKGGAYVSSLLPGKIFDQSEWCELPCKIDSTTIESAIYTARVIAEDLRYLGVNSWSTWTACYVGANCHAPSNCDRLFIVEPDMSDYAVMKRYYALKHFSAFIPSGSVRVDVTEAANLEGVISVAYERPDGRFALAAVNDSENDYNVDIGAFTVNESYVTDLVRNCESSPVNGQNGITLAAKSITTCILSEK